MQFKYNITPGKEDKHLSSIIFSDERIRGKGVSCFRFFVPAGTSIKGLPSEVGYLDPFSKNKITEIVFTPELIEYSRVIGGYSGFLEEFESVIRLVKRGETGVIEENLVHLGENFFKSPRVNNQQPVSYYSFHFPPIESILARNSGKREFDMRFELVKLAKQRGIPSEDLFANMNQTVSAEINFQLVPVETSARVVSLSSKDSSTPSMFPLGICTSFVREEDSSLPIYEKVEGSFLPRHRLKSSGLQTPFARQIIILNP